MQKVILSKYNLCLIDFYKALKDYEVYIINDLHSYNLLAKAKFNNDVKKLLTHHLIYFTCKIIIDSKSSEKEVFYVQPNVDLQLYTYYTKEKLDFYIHSTLKKIEKMLPLNFVYNDETFAQFCNKVTSSSGNGYEALLKLLSLLEEHKTENFRFNKIKNYAKRHNLTFLNQEFFNSFRTKQHLLV